MAMNGHQAHRGPDDSGIWRDRDRSVCLAMRRLSIVDVAEGQQPMTDAGGRTVLVFNGEIFNAPELRRDLEKSGTEFQTHHSDTEVVLQGYRRWGERVVDRLDGMFAFVVYDRDRGLLFGARDPSGIKPLYITQRGTLLAFASELKSLLALPWVGRAGEAVDLESVSHYLSLQFIPSPRTILRDVRKLPAGYSFEFGLSTGTLVQHRYWSLPRASVQPPPPREAAVEEVRRRLSAAISAWLMSDVPVGCSLSGGIDSATIVGAMRSLGVDKIRTWTLGFDDSPADDERQLARVVARRWNTEHTEVVISAGSLLDDLGAMVHQLDEPYGGGLPSWYIYKAMSGAVKVAMTGTGGDELFGNYDKWKAHIPWRPAGIRRIFRAVKEQGVANLARHGHGALYHGYAGERTKRSLLLARGGWPASTAAMLASHWRDAARSDPRDSVAAVDFRLQLPDEFLHMTDRFSMAWSIEARTPFLDRSLIEYVFSLPASVRIDDGTYKGLLRAVAEPWVPRELFGAPKRGFILPLRQWTRGRLRTQILDLLGTRHLRRQGIFNPENVSEAVQAHLDGLRDATQLVWTMFMFQLWWSGFTNPTTEYLQPPKGAQA